MGGLAWPSPPCLLEKTNGLRNREPCQDPEFTSCDLLVQVTTLRTPFITSKFDDEA